MSPEIASPDFVTAPATTTAMTAGTVEGGEELFPGLAVHVPPQLGGVVLVVSANPLKDAGAVPPDRRLSFHH